MYAKTHHFEWLRENIEQHLTRVDRVIAALLPASEDAIGHAEVEPWLDELFERRQSVQSTLFDLDRQIGGALAGSRVPAKFARGDER